MRKGQLRPVYGELDAPVGDTITIQSGGTFTLYDQTGAIVTGFSAVSVSGYEPGASTNPQVWYVLNTSSLNPSNLTTCVYSGVFAISALGSDTITRNYKIDIQINIVPYVEMLATYDETALATTPLYQLRLLIADTDMTSPTFTDNELSNFLSNAGGNINIAASVALSTAASNNAYLANVVKIGSFGNGQVEVYKALVERSMYFRSIAIVIPTVDSPDQIFAPNYSLKGGSPGSMNPW